MGRVAVIRSNGEEFIVDKQTDDEARVEQFYRLLSAYGLTGRTQPMDRRRQAEIDKLFPGEEE